MPYARSPAMPGGQDETRVYRIDTVRQGIDGVFLPLADSLFMIVAIGFFAVGDSWKGLIAASNFIGYLLSAPLTGILNRTGIRRARILSVLTAAASISLAIAAVQSSGIPFAIAAAFASAAVHLRQPFFTDLYGEHYPSERRARRISLGLRFNLLASLGAGLLYGEILDAKLSAWRGIVGAVSAALAISTILLSSLPEADPKPRSERWLQALALPFRNPLFLYVQASWMLVGFGNLWTLPLRAVYLAEAQRGLGLSPATVTLVLVIIPVAIRFAFNPLWASLYRRISFAWLRSAINFFFMVSIPLFFLTGNLWVICTASALYGIAASGTPFIRQLWVTRIAQPGEVRLYQSAHAFLAGLRGVAAPFIGFAVLGGLSFRTMGFISCGLTAASIAMMIPLMRGSRKF